MLSEGIRGFYEERECTRRNHVCTGPEIEEYDVVGRQGMGDLSMWSSSDMAKRENLGAMRKTVAFMFVFSVAMSVHCGCMRQGREEWLSEVDVFAREDSQLIQKWSGSGYEVLVYSELTPHAEPVQFKKGWWRGSYLSFYKVPAGKKSRICIMEYHGYPPLEYSFRNDVLTFVAYTYDPRADDFVPFVKEEVYLKAQAWKRTFQILLEKPAPNAREVQRLIGLLSMTEDEYFAQFPDVDEGLRFQGRALATLRNYALIDADYIEWHLSGLQDSAWWDDGHGAEELAGILQEVALISMIEGREESADGKLWESPYVREGPGRH